tara:strand:- start:10762 stop:10953 length:192 start_codon:yes stop_codon:yes gene_type:complete
MKKLLFILFLIACTSLSITQTRPIKAELFNILNNKSVPFVAVNIYKANSCAGTLKLECHHQLV